MVIPMRTIVQGPNGARLEPLLFLIDKGYERPHLPSYGSKNERFLTFRRHRCGQNEEDHFFTGEFEMKRTTVGVDIAKNVFQLHWVDADTGEIVNKQLNAPCSSNILRIANRALLAWRPVAVPSTGHGD